MNTNTIPRLRLGHGPPPRVLGQWSGVLARIGIISILQGHVVLFDKHPNPDVITYLNLTITAHTTWSSLNPAFVRYSTSHSKIGLGLLLTTAIKYSSSSTTSERALGRHIAYYPSSHGASLGLCYPLSHVVSTWCWVPAQRLNSPRLARIPLRASRNLSRTTRCRQMTAHRLLTRLFASWEDPATSQIRETGIKLQASRGL